MHDSLMYDSFFPLCIEVLHGAQYQNITPTKLIQGNIFPLTYHFLNAIIYFHPDKKEHYCYLSGDSAPAETVAICSHLLEDRLSLQYGYLHVIIEMAFIDLL